MRLPIRNRRAWMLDAASLGAACIAAPAVAMRGAAELRFGTTPVFLDEQVGLLSRWQQWLSQSLGRPVRFVQRGRYREIVDLLLDGGIDAAWLCGQPYVAYEDRLVLVAVPHYLAKPLYRSLLIVPASDPATAHVRDLAGTVFAFSDPHSNSGWLVPRVELLRAGRQPDDFFRRSFFTFGHRKVVEAVQSGLAQGGAVDGYVWDTLQAQQPASTAGVRVAWQSAPHGFPPIVARRSLPAPQRDAFAGALQAMASSDEGVAVLRGLNLDGFGSVEAGLFDSVRRLMAEHAAGLVAVR